MRITLNDIRSLGFQRIWKIMVDDEHCKHSQSFFQILRDMSSLLSVCKLTPFGVLSHWKSIEPLEDVEAGGIKLLMTTVNPFLGESEEIDVVSKRKFRNTWSTIWEKFGEACSLNSSDVLMLSDVGIKLPVLLSAIQLKDPVAIRVTKFSKSYLSAFGLTYETLNNCTEGYLYDTFESVRILCKFYNMVLGWYLSSQNEVDTADLAKYLVLSDFKSFADFFESGDRIWLSNSDLRVNSECKNMMSGSSLSGNTLTSES